jgi:hypothetical protein
MTDFHCPLEGCDGEPTIILNIPKNEICWDTIMRCNRCKRRFTVGQMVGMDDMPIPDMVEIEGEGEGEGKE